MKKSLFKITSGILISSGSLLVGASEAKAQALLDCPASGTAANLSAPCKGTPSRYQIAIYEMGVCTSNPIAGGIFNNSTCTATFTNPAGTSVDLAGGASFDIDTSADSATRPADGSYSHAYILISNQFGLRASYALSSGTTYNSNSSGAAVTGSAATDFSETLSNFGGGSGGCQITASETMSNGTLSALLATNTNAPATGCSGAARIIGAFEPTTPIAISASTTALQVTFSVTNNGLTIDERGTGLPVAFQSGPFNPTFTVVE